MIPNLTIYSYLLWTTFLQLSRATSNPCFTPLKIQIVGSYLCLILLVLIVALPFSCALLSDDYFVLILYLNSLLISFASVYFNKRLGLVYQQVFIKYTVG